MSTVYSHQKQRTTEVVVTTNGHSLLAFKGDLITHRIKTRGIYEGGPLSLVSRILQKTNNPVVFDIGANIGNHSLSFALDASAVHSFEPIKATFDLLQQNAHRNKLNNLHCYNFGFSDVKASALIYVDESGNIGGSSLEHKGINATEEIIDLVNGDEWIASVQNSINKVDFVKIDVEGHEPRVLMGLKGTLQKYRPIVMLEYNEQSCIKSIRQFRIFESCFADYNIFVLGNNYDHEYHEGKGNVKLRRFLTRILSKKMVKLYSFDSRRTYHNILLVPKEKNFLIPKDCLS